MSDGRHAEFLQVVTRQIGEDFAIDLILTERPFVFAEPEAPQPVSDVHGRVTPRFHCMIRWSASPVQRHEPLSGRADHTPKLGGAFRT